MSRYIHTPNSIRLDDVINNKFTLSSSQYLKLLLPNKNYMLVRDFLSRPLSRSDLGIEVGSLSYINQSPCRFIRTKALQAHSFLPIFNSETALPILPSEFVQKNLKKGDLLISKDSNIGEIVILDKDYNNFMLSGAIYRLPVKEEWKYYLLAFIKHEIFREQLDFMVPKGATIRHAKTLFLDCKIPLPSQNKEDTIRYISLLTQAIINKEAIIKKRHSLILDIINTELESHQGEISFSYNLPRLSEIEEVGRLDASLYKSFYKQKLYKILNYDKGYSPLTNQNLTLIPGPSLELRLLGTRVDSDNPNKGFFRLITPKQITNYGTVKYNTYIGTPAKIAKVQFGDILFGESGTGRTMVFLDRDDNTINNAHAHILRSNIPNDIPRVITIRSILQYYKEIGITDCMTVGGSGGHLSPSYFDRILIPNFPNSVQEKISKLYYSSNEYDTSEFNLDNFLDKDNNYNLNAGIYELDSSLKKLKSLLDNAITEIINDNEVKFNFSEL